MQKMQKKKNYKIYALRKVFWSFCRRSSLLVCNFFEFFFIDTNARTPYVHHCNTLQHAATLCNTLQHATTHSHCNTLQHMPHHMYIIKWCWNNIYTQCNDVVCIHNQMMLFWHFVCNVFLKWNCYSETICMHNQLILCNNMYSQLQIGWHRIWRLFLKLSILY